MLADEIASVRFDEDGLVAAIVQDDATDAVLMVAYMTKETLELSLAQGRTVFWSRSRQEVWRKGDTSGDHQYIRSVHSDCDGDALLFRVTQVGGGACHTGEYSCFFRPIEFEPKEVDGLDVGDPNSDDPHSDDSVDGGGA